MFMPFKWSGDLTSQVTMLNGMNIVVDRTYINNVHK